MVRTQRSRRRSLALDCRDVLFAHWEADPATVAARLPDGLSVATHDGRAWLGVVAFAAEPIVPRGLPAALSRPFAQVDLRTYVEHRGERGVRFLSLDADDPLAVVGGRALAALPYYRARTRLRNRAGEVTFASRRTHRGAPPAHFAATYRGEGDAEPAEPGSLAAFLTESDAFFVGDDPLLRGAVARDPWPLQSADVTVHANTLFDASEFDRPDGEPVAHYASGGDVDLGRVRPVAGRRSPSDRPCRAFPVGCGADRSRRADRRRAETDEGPIRIDVDEDSPREE